MLSLAFSAAMLGIEGYVVRVEADSSPGTPGFSIIGLPDRAPHRGVRPRTRGDFQLGIRLPGRETARQLSPADVRKAGPAFDLAIALALLTIDDQSTGSRWRNYIALGELTLDGSLRGSAESFRWCSARATPASASLSFR